MFVSDFDLQTTESTSSVRMVGPRFKAFAISSFRTYDNFDVKDCEEAEAESARRALNSSFSSMASASGGDFDGIGSIFMEL